MHTCMYVKVLLPRNNPTVHIHIHVHVATASVVLKYVSSIPTRTVQVGIEDTYLKMMLLVNHFNNASVHVHVMMYVLVLQSLQGA